MALFDWNKNGKDDMFDSMMDYALYKETFGKEEEDDGISSYGEYEPDDFNDYETDEDNSAYIPPGEPTLHCTKSLTRRLAPVTIFPPLS